MRVNLEKLIVYRNGEIFKFLLVGGIAVLIDGISYALMVRGFDLEHGLPKPKNYRDEPYKWDEGFYRMDKLKLEKLLQFSKLIISDVKDMTRVFISKYQPAPIGCIMFDLDLYSSTKNAFHLFKENEKWFLPRVMCNFDVIGSKMV